MKCSLVTGLLTTLSIGVSAIPTAPMPAPTQFYLQTEAVSGSMFDGLYISTYHTGAGMNILYGISSKLSGTPAYLKGKELYFNLGSGKDDQYPMQLAQTDLSASWGTCSADVVYKPQKTFKIEDGYLVLTGKYPPQKFYNYSDKGAHWRICLWTHAVPELFWNYPDPSDNPNRKFNPSTCSLVNLKAVPV